MESGRAHGVWRGAGRDRESGIATADWIETDRDLVEQVRAAVETTAVSEMHTHLYAAPFGGVLLRGMDELLTYRLP